MPTKKKLNKSQRSRRQSAFAVMQPRVMPHRNGADGSPEPQRFGGRNFFPTEDPRASIGYHGPHIPRGVRKSIVAKVTAGGGGLKELAQFGIRAVVARAKVVIDDPDRPGLKKMVAAIVGIHRGNWVNTRHNPVGHFSK